MIDRERVSRYPNDRRKPSLSEWNQANGPRAASALRRESAKFPRNLADSRRAATIWEKDTCVEG